MSYRVTILDTQTGERRTYTEDLDWNGDFVWSEGNFGCDCNRGNFFAQAIGEDADSPCGDDRYLVHIETMDGSLLYQDENWPDEEEVSIAAPAMVDSRQ